ncbi:hypothetical protein ACEZCY_23575 [Streptacidiphilus sp. N1-12]|uniref:Uncharacterized protein n=2 Tax=Streptacidiphilus alkalitolerans TaxID=3342712 RepID=A0ABV6VEC6_9ACTN
MSVLAWGIIPLVAGLFAAVWVSWSARTRTTGDGASLAGHQRFREAMERSSGPKQ